MSTEEFKVSGGDVVDAVKRIIAQGNARRIIIKNEAGATLIEFPLTLGAIGAIGAIIAPVLAAVGAIAALVTKCTIVVERRDTPPTDAPAQEGTIEA